MAGKNKGFASSLVETIGGDNSTPKGAERLGKGVLNGRNNRLSELASGSLVNRAVELVDPARCRMWSAHNRDYAALNEERCADLITSLKAQGKQEVAAIVRRLENDEQFDFEVISGARRHWSISWLRKNNYPEFRFLVEIRVLSDEEAFRLSDIENRAREDLSDFERSHEYLKALEAYYGGKQVAMAERINVSVSWLSRYLDLARLPKEILGAFTTPHDLRIKHITKLKPVLKAPEMRKRAIAEAVSIAQARTSGGAYPQTAAEVIRSIERAAKPPKRTGTPKKTGKDESVITNSAGKPLFKIDQRSKKGISLTLLPGGGGTMKEAKSALEGLLAAHWEKK